MTSRNVLKQWFGSRKKPTAGQFAEIFESFIHRTEDIIGISKIQGLADALTAKADQSALQSIRDYVDSLSGLEWKGVAQAETVPVSPTQLVKYDGIAGVTYPNYLDANGVAISIPDKVEDKYVIEPVIYSNAGHWKAKWRLMDSPQVDLSGYATKSLVGSAVALSQLMDVSSINADDVLATIAIFPNSYVNNLGQLNPSGSSWSSSDFIFTPGGKAHHYKGRIYGDACIAFYDHNKTFISAVKPGPSNTNLDPVIDYDFSTPSNASYTRFSVYLNPAPPTIALTYTDSTSYALSPLVDSISASQNSIVGLQASVTSLNLNKASVQSVNLITDLVGITAYSKGDTVNGNNTISGSYVDQNGNIVTGFPNWAHSDFVPIVPSKAYRYNGFTYQGGCIAFYDSNKVFISAFVPSAYTIDNPLTIYNFTAGANHYYVRYSVYRPDLHPSKLTYEDNVPYSFSSVLNSIEDQLGTLITPVENRLVLPAYLDCPVGRNTDYFLDAITMEPDSDQSGSLLISGSTAATIRSKNILRYSPAAVVADLNMTFTKADAGLKNLYSKQMKLRSVSRSVGNGTDQRNIIISGDSLINSGYSAAECYLLLAQDGDFVINQIGTKVDAATKHEGRSSWSWADYLNPTYETTPFAGSTNAFMHNGVLNFQYYFDTYFPAITRRQIDVFYMALGTNDVGQGYTLPSSAQINNIISNAKTFITAFLTAFPTAKFVVGLPGVGAPVAQSANANNAVFKRSIQSLNARYIAEFDNGIYHANVTVAHHGAFIDRYGAFPFTDSVANDYSTTIVRSWTNTVHPLETGYRQYGRGIYNKVRAILSGVL